MRRRTAGNRASDVPERLNLKKHRVYARDSPTGSRHFNENGFPRLPARGYGRSGERTFPEGAAMARSRGRGRDNGRTETYQHPGADLTTRPEIGTQPQFRKRKPPATYPYDSSLSPSLEWDGRNSARERGEWLLACIEEAAKLAPLHRLQHVKNRLFPSTRTCT
jgi:hypothetical protein